MLSDELDQEVAELLSDADQRYTAGRRRLIAVLLGGTNPLTIDEIVEADPTQAVSSVYRNLSILERAGAVTRIVTNGDFARFELAERFTHHHHHLICTSCGAVEDFSIDAHAEAELDLALEKAAAAHGFQASEHRLDLLGRCANCTSS